MSLQPPNLNSTNAFTDPKTGKLTSMFGYPFLRDLLDWIKQTAAGIGDVVGPSSSVNNEIVLFNGTTGKLIKAATGTGVVHATSGVYSASDVTLAEIVPATAASRLLGRRSGSAGDWEEVSLGTGLSMSSGAVLSATASTTITSALGITIDGGGAVITTGVKGFLWIPMACTITAATLLSTDASVTSGSIVIDVWKDTYANYPPTVADTITASAKPTLSSAIKSQDTTLTGWTTSVSAGDVLGFNVDSASTVTRVTLELKITVP